MYVLTRIAAVTCGVALLAGGLVAPAQAHGGGHGGHGGHGAGAGNTGPVDDRTTIAVAGLRQLNTSGARGVATVRLRGTRVDVRLVVSGVLRGVPHAMHFHAGTQGRCPGAGADTNNDGVVSVTEGHPFYGDVVTSLTTSGDTSAASALAVDRFPTAPRGVVTYSRRLTVDADTAARIRAGNAVLVVHGIDANGSGAYDGALKSDLDPTLPMEATAPAACGTVRAVLTF